MNSTTGQTALNARRARIASALVTKGYLDRSQAVVAADVLVGYGVTVRQVEATQASFKARRLITRAIKLAREATS